MTKLIARQRRGDLLPLGELFDVLPVLKQRGFFFLKTQA